jgi:hypothetical protein
MTASSALAFTKSIGLRKYDHVSLIAIVFYPGLMKKKEIEEATQFRKPTQKPKAILVTQKVTARCQFV